MALPEVGMQAVLEGMPQFEAAAKKVEDAYASISEAAEGIEPAVIEIDDDALDRVIADVRSQFQEMSDALEVMGEAQDPLAATRAEFAAMHGDLNEMNAVLDETVDLVEETDAAMLQLAEAEEKAAIEALAAKEAWESIQTVSGFAKQAGDALLGLAQQSVMTSARAEELYAVLDNLAAQSGQSADAMRGQVAAIKDLGITTDVATNLVSQFSRSNLDLSQASTLARIAQDAAVISMEDSSQALSGLLHGILTLQPEVLRYRGLIVDLEGEYRKWSEATGRSTQTLTGAEKQQIALNAVIAQGATIAGTYEASMGTASKQLRSFDRYIVELKEDFGNALLPAFTQGVFVIKDLTKAAMELPQEIKATVAVTGALTGAMLKGGASAVQFGSQVAMLGMALKVLGTSTTGLTAALGPLGLVAALAVATVGIITYANAAEEAHIKEAAAAAASADNYAVYADATDTAAKGAYQLTYTLWELVKAQESSAQAAFAEGLIRARKDLEGLAVTFGTMPDVFRSFREAGDVVSQGFDDMTLAVLADQQSVRELGETYGKSGAELDKWTATVTAAATAEIAYRRELEAATEVEIGRINVLKASLKMALEDIKVTDGMRNSAFAFTKQIKDLAEETGLTAQQVFQFKIVMGLTDEKVREVAESLQVTADEMYDLAQQTSFTLDGVKALVAQGMGADEIKEYDKALEKAAETTGLTRERLMQIAGAAENPTKAVEDYAVAWEQATEAQKEAMAAMEGLAGAWTGGLLSLQQLAIEQQQSAADYEKALSDLSASAGKSLDKIKKKYQGSLPDSTDVSTRAGMAADAWDEYALRMGALMDGVQGAQEQGWMDTLRAMTDGTALSLDAVGGNVQVWLANLKQAFYAGKLPELINKDAPEWKEHAANVSAAQAEETAAVNREAAARRAALEAERQAEIAAQKAAREQALIEMALQLAQESGLLQQWAQERFGALEGIGDTATEVMALLQSGMISLDPALKGILESYITGITGMLDETEAQAADTKAALSATVGEAEAQAGEMDAAAAKAQEAAVKYGEVAEAVAEGEAPLSDLTEAQEDLNAAVEAAQTPLDDMSAKILAVTAADGPVDKFKIGMTDMKTALDTGLADMQAALVAQLPAIETQMVTGADKMVTAFDNAVPKMKTAGKDLAAGVEQGFKDRWKAFIEWLTTEINNLINLIKELTGEESPSKVMAEIGLNLAKGLQIGIEDGTPGVEDAMGDMAGAGLGDFQGENLGAAMATVKDALEVMEMLGHYQTPDMTRMQQFFYDWTIMLAALIGTEAKPGIFRTNWGLDPDRISNVRAAVETVQVALEALTGIGGYTGVDLANIDVFTDQLVEVMQSLSFAFTRPYAIPEQAKLQAFQMLLNIASQAIAALKAVSGYTGVDLTQLALFGQQVGDVVMTIYQSLTELDMPEAVDVSLATNILSLVSRAAEALTDLAAWEPKALRAAEFAETVVEVIGTLADAMAEGVPQEQLTAAAEWAEGAGSVLGIIGMAVDAITDLASYVSPQEIGAKATDLGLDIAAATVAMVEGFQTAAGLSQEALDAAAEWADGAGKILSVVGEAMEGIFLLEYYWRPENLQSQAAMLGEDVATAIAALTAPFGQDVTEIERLAAIGEALDKAGSGLMSMLDALWSIGSYQGGIGAGLGMFIDDLTLLLEALEELGEAFPWWLVPGSPTPLEIGLRGIADQAVRAGAALYPLAQAQPVASRTTVSLQFGPTTIASGMDQAEFESRVVHAVTKAVRLNA